MWLAGADGWLLVHSDAETWKVNRIRRDNDVCAAPSGATGKVRGETCEGEAAILADTSVMEELAARKYGMIYRAIGFLPRDSRALRRRSAPESVTIEIVPAPASASRPDGPSAR